MIINMLRLSSRIGHLSQILCLGVYFYNTERYHKVQDIIKIFRKLYSQPFILFDKCGLGRTNYQETIGRYHLCKRMRKAWMYVVYFPISPLTEFYSVPKKSILHEDMLNVSPLVAFHTLSVLCNHKLGNRFQCLQSLTDLQTLLLNNDSRCVPFDTEVVSWHLMGICQYVMKDLHGAFQSFQNSLRPKQLHRLKKITVIRMCHVLYQLTK